MTASVRSRSLDVCWSRRDARRAHKLLLSRRQCLAGLAALLALPRARAVTTQIASASAIDLAAGLRAGQWSSAEIVDACLQRITALNGELGRFDANGALNAFIRTFPERARSDTRQAKPRGRQPSWSGIPVALKDVFSVAGEPVTVGTPAFVSYRAPRDCALWSRWKEGGAVLLGHTQAQRFVSGITTPQTANPWNPQLIAGGSSGGSGAAVAAGLVPVALGTETAGSLVYPALCCGVTTFKPSYGLLSLAGVFPGLASFDVAGPIARTVADCAWVAATLAGIDADDPVTGEQPPRALQWPDYVGPAASERRPLRGVRLLVATNERYADFNAGGEPATASIDSRIEQCLRDFLRSLQQLGAELIGVEVPAELGRLGTFRRERQPRLGDRSAHEFLVAADTLASSLPAMQRW